MADIINDKLDAIAKHLDSLHKRMDESDQERADSMKRMDAFEKERKDAAEEEEKGKADAAAKLAAERADAEASTGTEENRGKFASEQMHCDAAWQAWGHQAPHALSGESLRDFQIRLLEPLKKHSKAYKDSALSLIGDDAAFTVIRDSIIADAVDASNTSYTPMGPLRKVVSKMDSGHVITKFIGDPAVAWAPFSGGATKFGRINMDVANRARS